jgi:hypothetical protein
MSEDSGSCTDVEMRGAINSRRMRCTLSHTPCSLPRPVVIL